MRSDQFKSLLNGLNGLTVRQLDELRKAVEAQHQRTQALRALEAAGEGLGCPHCSSFKFSKNGHSRGLQRFLCTACSRTFNAATNTPLSRLRGKERFFQHGECLAQGLSIRAAAAEMGVAVSTAFRMRHRFLQEVVSHQPRHVAGLLEADETYVRESQKGSRHLSRPARHRGGAAPRAKGARRDILVPVLVGRLRGQPHVVDQVLTAMTIPQATEALRGSVGPDTLLCTDGSGALRGAAKALGVTSKSIAVGYGGRGVEGVYHVQTVNSYHERLQSWLTRGLRGVSTKYLPNYLAWMRVAEWYKGDLKPEHFVISGLGRQLINT
jgi:transposase-like protein